MIVINKPLTLENILQAAFTDGLSDKEYCVMLAALKPYLPEPMLVQAVAGLSGRPYTSVYADLLQIKENYIPTLVDSAAIVKRLDAAGFFEWLREAHMVEI